MAQRILGLDVGDDTIRVAVLESSLRTVRLVAIHEEAIGRKPHLDGRSEAGDTLPGGPEGVDETPPEDAERARAEAQRRSVLEALIRLRERGALEADHVVAAIPGDRVFTRLLRFPFNDQKRIDQVVGFELEEHIPFAAHEVVIDHRILRRDGDGAVVFAAAVPRQEVADYLELLGEVGLDPRIVSLNTFAYTKLVEARREGETEGGDCVAVVDIGRCRTDVAVMLHGELAFARTVRRGGRHVLREISRALGVDRVQAERTLKAYGRILPHGDEADDAGRALSAAIQRGLAPILRDINQTFRSHERLHGDPVEAVLLAGGLGHLPGLDRALHTILEVPASPLRGVPAQVQAGDLDDDVMMSHGVAIGLALELVRGGSRDSVNFRRGPFAYRGDFQYLAERAPALIAMATLVLAAAIGLFMVRKGSLVQERDRLAEGIRSFTKQVVGKAIEDPALATSFLQAPPRKGYEDALPQRTTTWILFEVSGAVDRVRHRREARGGSGETIRPGGPPAPGRLAGAGSAGKSDDDAGDGEEGAVPGKQGSRRYDVEVKVFEFTAAGGRLTGEANVLEARDLFVQELMALPCFAKVQIEETSKVMNDRHSGWVQFNLQVGLDCGHTAKAKKAGDKKGEGRGGAETKRGAGADKGPAVPSSGEDTP